MLEWIAVQLHRLFFRDWIWIIACGRENIYKYWRIGKKRIYIYWEEREREDSCMWHTHTFIHMYTHIIFLWSYFLSLLSSIPVQFSFIPLFPSIINIVSIILHSSTHNSVTHHSYFSSLSLPLYFIHFIFVDWVHALEPLQTDHTIIPQYKHMRVCVSTFMWTLPSNWALYHDWSLNRERKREETVERVIPFSYIVIICHIFYPN